MTTKRFIKPFGEDGLRVPVSDTPSGTDVNYETGYPEEYGFDPVTDPAARFVQLTEENQILNDITGNLKLWQENVFPDFITAANNGGVAWKYKKGDTVLYNDNNYESLEDNNTDLPTTEKWVIKKPNEVLRAILIGLGYSGNYGFFEKGFVYREAGDLGFSSDGDAYIYAGVDLLPVTVQSGTDPESLNDYDLVMLADGYQFKNVDLLKSSDLTGIVNTFVYTVEYHNGSGYGGAEYLIISDDTGYDIDEVVNFTLDSGLYAVHNNKNITLEQCGAVRGSDSTSALLAALLSGKNIKQEGQYNYNIDDHVFADKVIPFADHDFNDCTLTITGTPRTFGITTKGPVGLTVRNLTIQGENLCAVGWRHRSFRQDFTGYFKVFDSKAYNLLQIVDGGGGQSAGFYAEGGMELALFENVTVDGVDSDAGLANKIARGILCRSIFELSAQNGKDFPRKFIVKNSDIFNVNGVDDGDNVYGEVLQNSDERNSSLMIVHSCNIGATGKRSFKSKYATTHISKNEITRTVQGVEEVAFQDGGGSFKDNKITYEEGISRMVYGGIYSDDSNSSLHVSGNVAKLAAGKTISELVRTGEIIDLANASVYQPAYITDNKVYGDDGSVDYIVLNRNASASAGNETGMGLVVKGNIAPLSSGVVAFDRGSALSEPSAFYNRINNVDISFNANISASEVPDIVDLTNNISKTFINKYANRNCSISSLSSNKVVTDFRYNIGQNSDRANVSLNFDVPMQLNQGVNALYIECLAASAGGTSRIAYKKGFLHIDAGVITEHDMTTVNNGDTGSFTVSYIDANTVRVSKAAGSLANFVAGYVMVRGRYDELTPYTGSVQ